MRTRNHRSSTKYMNNSLANFPWLTKLRRIYKNSKATESHKDLPAKGKRNSDALSTLQDVNIIIYNITSDIFFFFGSVCYLAVAKWHASHVNVVETAWVSSLAAGGTLLYALNANAGIVFAILRMRRNPRGSFRWRESAWNLLSNVFFGLGVAIDIATASSTRDVESAWRSLAVHLYFLSGLVSVARFNVSCTSCYQLLTGTGDCLFLIGSISDLAISYITTGLNNPKEINRFWLISSFLWLLNSILYLVADLMEFLDWRNQQRLRLKPSQGSLHILVQQDPAENV